MKIKKISSMAICLICIMLTFCACQNSEPASNSTNTTGSDNKPALNIGICLGEGNEYYNEIMQGYTAGISDYFTDYNVILNTVSADDALNTDTICADFIATNTPLIFAVGENSLQSARHQTSTIPIVSAAIMDYERVLELPENKEWDGTTKTNVTGVSSAPNMDDVLSLIIEATPDITSVGILIYPGDPDSVYQCKTLEKYLDQAGFAWKEYAFYSPEISVNSAREITQFACQESSALYIPAESSLRDRLNTIKSVALDYKTPTIAGDEYIGSQTLVSMYNDPFDQGYEAAETTYEILAKNKKPGDIAIKQCNEESQQKLYAGDITEKLGYVFPKSFREHDEFLSNYKRGSKTVRLETEN